MQWKMREVANTKLTEGGSPVQRREERAPNHRQEPKARGLAVPLAVPHPNQTRVDPRSGRALLGALTSNMRPRSSPSTACRWEKNLRIARSLHHQSPGACAVAAVPRWTRPVGKRSRSLSMVTGASRAGNDPTRARTELRAGAALGLTTSRPHRIIVSWTVPGVALGRPRHGNL